MVEVKFIVEETSTGFSAYAENLPVYTTGKSITMLQFNIEEAMSLYQEEVGGNHIDIIIENSST
ncbi:hypothetical protein IDJ77_25240 [Mucilaginibacter sp. ZT4R22]|uniref:Uncharacterized protein n=1 Tax=Mucilaginibacter pankratovii TaxID=2772110 RepID=A0ABR7WXX3_9SPHI|nr:hypothetical protein [Mucilaginibacter pankratovii]MBD1367141.1 hypothetical protein [Mucilaginibacter pankratovii]